MNLFIVKKGDYHSQELLCQTDAPHDETKHIAKFWKVFSHMFSAVNLREKNVNEPLKLSSFWQRITPLYSITVQVCHVSLQHFETCHISTMNCITSVS